MAKNSQQEIWRSRIMAVTDRKLLEYIQSQCNIRLDIARADHNMTKPEPKKSDKNSTMPSSPYDTPPRKLAPIKMVAKSDNDGDENAEEQYY